jgi:hypothetical protein
MGWSNPCVKTRVSRLFGKLLSRCSGDAYSVIDTKRSSIADHPLYSFVVFLTPYQSSVQKRIGKIVENQLILIFLHERNIDT